jgi:hypothetical protein
MKFASEGVHGDRHLTRVHFPELGFLEIRRNPDVIELANDEHLLARLDSLP